MSTNESITLSAQRQSITSHITVMTDAHRTAHDTFVGGYIEALKPMGAIEHDLADSVAEGNWRLKRFRALEENIYALGYPELTDGAEDNPDPERSTALAHARSFMDDPKKFQLLTLIETRLQRSVHKNLELLRELQAERKAAYEKAVDEAMIMADMAVEEGRTYDPATDAALQNGFAFSITEFNTAVARKRCVIRAWKLAKTNGYSPEKNSAAHSRPMPRPKAA